VVVILLQYLINFSTINQNQKQVILQLQRDLSDKDRNIDNLMAQVNELIEDSAAIRSIRTACSLLASGG
jgi:hypothetical protein